MDEPHHLTHLVDELVGRVQPRQRIDHDAQHDRRRDTLVGVARQREQARERLTFDVLHNDVIASAALTDLDDRYDVRMVDARRESRLVEKHLDELALLRQMRMQALDGDEALEPADARKSAEKDNRHTSDGELANDLVTIDSIAGARVEKR